jgi:UDP-glucose 4-epimerase
MSLNVLITGNCGFVGAALTKYLSSISFIRNVVGYDIVNGDDICDTERLTMVMSANSINLVIHLAALSTVSACNESPLLAVKINASGTRSVLRAMTESGCQHIIYASTSSVYGKSRNLPYRENTLLVPCSPYGISKLLGEHAIFNHYDVQNHPGSYVILRFFNIVGSISYKEVDSVASAGYDRLFGALESGNITIYGNDYHTRDGTCERDYVALKDVCRAILDAISAIIERKRIRTVVNICRGIPVSVKQIISMWNTISNSIHNKESGYENCHRLPYVKYSYGSRRKGDPARVYGSNDKAYKLIDWKPRKKMEDIIYDLSQDKQF